MSGYTNRAQQEWQSVGLPSRSLMGGASVGHLVEHAYRHGSVSGSGVGNFVPMQNGGPTAYRDGAQEHRRCACNAILSRYNTSDACAPCEAKTRQAVAG